MVARQKNIYKTENAKRDSKKENNLKVKCNIYVQQLKYLAITVLIQSPFTDYHTAKNERI
jgi:hypothetical protein